MRIIQLKKNIEKKTNNEIKYSKSFIFRLPLRNLRFLQLKEFGIS